MTATARNDRSLKVNEHFPVVYPCRSPSKTEKLGPGVENSDQRVDPIEIGVLDYGPSHCLYRAGRSGIGSVDVEVEQIVELAGIATSHDLVGCVILAQR